MRIHGEAETDPERMNCAGEHDRGENFYKFFHAQNFMSEMEVEE